MGGLTATRRGGNGLLWAPMNAGFGCWVDVGFVGVRMGLERVFFRWVIGYIAREHLLHNVGKFVSCSWILCYAVGESGWL